MDPPSRKTMLTHRCAAPASLPQLCACSLTTCAFAGSIDCASARAAASTLRVCAFQTPIKSNGVATTARTIATVLPLEAAIAPTIYATGATSTLSQRAARTADAGERPRNAQMRADPAAGARISVAGVQGWQDSNPRPTVLETARVWLSERVQRPDPPVRPPVAP